MYLIGCSFTENVKTRNPDLHKLLVDKYGVVNLGKASMSNFQIRDTLFNLPNNSKAIVQWSALTRPTGIKHNDIDHNLNLNTALVKNNNSLHFLINTFVKVVLNGVEILKAKDIDAYHYLGWMQWSDSEIDDELRIVLESLPINWFKVPKTIDITNQGCWDYDYETYNCLYNENTSSRMLWEWYPTSWGGMSEWIRYNIKNPDDRYLGFNDEGIFDNHPSITGNLAFYENIIIPEIQKLLQ